MNNLIVYHFFYDVFNAPISHYYIDYGNKLSDDSSKRLLDYVELIEFYG